MSNVNMIDEESGTATLVDVHKHRLNSANQKFARKKIWVDLDNSPHVPFFRPIIDELRKKNYEVFVTARDAYQVRELIEFYHVDAKVVGKHYGRHKILKAIGTCWRALALARIVRSEKPVVAICHGSRSLVIACTFLRIPSIMLMDYEFGTGIPGITPTWLMVPSVVSNEQMGTGPQMIKYPGIKEDVYLSQFCPDATLRKRLGIASNDLLVTVRPPATEAHYHNPEADKLLTETLNRFVRCLSTKVLLLPRNKRQETKLRSDWATAIASGRFLIPRHVEDGLNLIWNSDLVVSGGGTMNREAAALGVPVYSIFRGKIGAVDHYLAEQGRLVLIETPLDVKTKIKAVRRDWSRQPSAMGNSPAFETVINEIVSIIESNRSVGRQAWVSE